MEGEEKEAGSRDHVVKIQGLRLVNYKDRIVPLKGSFKEAPWVAFDIETVNGRPFTIQFYDGAVYEFYYDVGDSITKIFLDYLRRKFRPGLVVWAFNLAHDLPIIFHAFQKHFVETDIDFATQGWRFHFCCDRHWFGTGYQGDRSVRVRDAACFVPGMSLESACEKLKLPVRKANKPDGLGERKLPRRLIESYAVQDAIATWHLAGWIVEWHRKYDVPLGVSIADLAGKVFRKHFMRKGQWITVPDFEILESALRSYHGGKTESYYPTPCLVKDVAEYDIISAYPHAMRNLPNPVGGAYYETDSYTVPHGVYCVKGRVDCPYIACYTDDFRPLSGPFESWITGYEIASAVATGCLRVEAIRGYTFRPGRSGHHPLRAFVDHFFKKKQEALNDSVKLFMKIILNSLYGKFISRVEVASGTDVRWRGGSLFQPFWGSLITGFVRARLHEESHRYRPVCVSTDSMFLHQANGPHPQVGSRMGDFESKESGRGDLILLRNKLYLVVNPKDHHELKKWAGHGYLGRKREHGLRLLEMYHKRETRYVHRRMVKLREALRMKDEDLQPFTMRDEIREIKVNWSGYQEFS